MPPNAHKSSLKIINAKYAAEMYEPEAESDEDCEVYFLKPVNEYNIVDKIKEANKQLFAIYDEEEAGAGQDNPNSSSRKVTFALNLEDYEPMTAQQQQPEEVSSPPAELLQQLAQLKLRTERGERFAAIAEEEPVQELARAAMEQQQAEPEVEEDICEEILELSEMENSSSKQPEASQIPASMDYEEDDFLGVDEDDLQAASETLTADIQKHRIARQNTFDLNAEEMPDSDQRSLTNLLTESDCEEDERVVNEARIKLRQAYKSLYKTLDAKGQAQINRLTGQDNGDVEEDDLSIIVASYIPDDFELDERSIYYKKDDETAHTPNNNTSRSTSTKTFFNARRFSFRRRARATPSAPVAPTPDIKMNYKICCEHRNALQEKLPRYTGYMSEYGLSAKQLQQRDQQLRRKQRFAMEQTLNRNEHELKKLQDNERAFTTWLKNKMRYPINKTRNMFDATRRRATVAAAASSPNPHQQKRREQQHEQLRSGRRRDSNEVHTYRYLLGSWNK